MRAVVEHCCWHFGDLVVKDCGWVRKVMKLYWIDVR